MEMPVIAETEITFDVNKNEWKVAKEWMDTHECEILRKNKEINKSVVTPVSCFSWTFTQTGIGHMCKISCKCGDSRDITDYGCF